MTNKPAIDLSRTAWERTFGDLTVIGTWIMTTGRPVMVIIPTFVKRSHERIIPCLVPMDMAYLWDEHMGDPAHCAQTTFAFANALGMSPYEPRNLIRITSLIREHLGDLLTIAPLPESELEVVADAIMTDPNTGKVTEAEIVDHV